MADRHSGRAGAGRFWTRLLGAATVAVAGRQVVGMLNLRSTLSWLGEGPTSAAVVDTVPREAAFPVHFVVPVLHEQAHVVAMMTWFSALLQQLPGSTLTVVTSERETTERALRRRTVPGAGGAATTSDVVAGAVVGGSVHPRVRHVHYRGTGRKAAQVNFAARGLDRSGYVAVYDVDSRPSVDLLRTTLDTAGSCRDQTGELPPVIQQSARFVVAGAHPAAWQRFVCRGAARLQTLWTLRREIPSFRRYCAATGIGAARPGVVRRGLAQTVGHGLLVRADVLAGIGGFPTYTVLDDFPLGYRLSVLGVNVVPVAVTTQVPAAGSVAELIAQGRRWFHNYLDYPLCARRARSEGVGDSWSRASALGVGLYRGATWLLRSTGAAAVAVIVAPGVNRTTALLTGVVAPIRMLARADARPLPVSRLLIESSELLAANLISSAGPALAVVERMVSGQPGAGISPKAGARNVPTELP